jgi:hypothetical protein
MPKCAARCSVDWSGYNNSYQLGVQVKATFTLPSGSNKSYTVKDDNLNGEKIYQLDEITSDIKGMTDFYVSLSVYASSSVYQSTYSHSLDFNGTEKVVKLYLEPRSM